MHKKKTKLNQYNQQTMVVAMIKVTKNPLTLLGVIAPCLRTLEGAARTPIKQSGIFHRKCGRMRGGSRSSFWGGILILL